MINNVICNFHKTEANFQYGRAVFFYILLYSSTCVLFFKIPVNDPISEFNKKWKFHTHPYINIAKFFFIFDMHIFQYHWSHTYIKFWFVYAWNFIYIFINFQIFLFYSVLNNRHILRYITESLICVFWHYSWNTFIFPIHNNANSIKHRP